MQRAVAYALLNGCELRRHKSSGRLIIIAPDAAKTLRAILYPFPNERCDPPIATRFYPDVRDFPVVEWADYNSKLGRLHTKLIDQLLEQ